MISSWIVTAETCVHPFLPKPSSAWPRLNSGWKDGSWSLAITCSPKNVYPRNLVWNGMLTLFLNIELENVLTYSWHKMTDISVYCIMSTLSLCGSSNISLMPCQATKSSRATAWESKPQSEITRSSLPSFTPTSTDQDRDGTPWPAGEHQGNKCSTLAKSLVTFGPISTLLVSPLALQLISAWQKNTFYHKKFYPKSPIIVIMCKDGWQNNLLVAN